MDPAEIVRGPDRVLIVGHVGRYGVVSWLDREPEPGMRELGLAVETGAVGDLWGDAVLVFRHERRSVGPESVGRPVLLAAGNGEILIRKLVRSTKSGLVHAAAAVGPALFDVRPAWMSSVLAIRY